MQLVSKLPQVGTTIFTIMSQLAERHQAINLSQGFPDFSPPQALLECVTAAMRAGKNQYAPMMGVLPLRQAIAEKTAACYGYRPDLDTEITVTSGATEALFCAITAVIHAGDEAIIFDPAYDSYAPVIELAGGRAVRIPLQYPEYQIDWQRVREACNERTRLLIINSPHNPTGAVLQAADIAQLQALSEKYAFFIIADEVYEHIYFDGAEHLSILKYADLRQRAFVISSFGKTYHCTGWKLGYCVAPALLSREFRKLHQYNTFASSTPMQFAIAEYLQAEPQHYRELPAFYQRKRDLFRAAMATSKFKPLACKGTYFQLFDYRELSEQADTAYAEYLTREVGVAAIPISVFYGDGRDDKVLRFCFAKNDQILQAAAAKLTAL